MEDAENRSRRSNLIFYGIPDTSSNEFFARSAEIIIRHCSEYLNCTVKPDEIEGAHRLGRQIPGRNRPIIVKFSNFKTKDAILANARKLKGTADSIGEDFSKQTQTARKHLITFAKSKSVPFSLRYRTLHFGPKRFFFDDSSQTAKEL